VGVRLADEIIVQTNEQVALCKRAFGRDPIVIRSIAESAQKQQLDPNAFLWIGRLVWYKNPLAFVELARSLPDVTFRMVGVPVPGGEDFAAAIMDSAAEVQNLEFVDPRPRNELMELIARAVAITNTAEFEGMPNILLEGWARGVPALVLTHDPDGVVSRFGLGGFAEGGQQRLVELAAKLWNERHARRELSRRCREYVAAHHSVAVIGSKWEEALSLQRSSEYASPALVEAA
jgi:glycosyltransferase involved in cell wall biosynthesis